MAMAQIKLLKSYREEDFWKLHSKLTNSSLKENPFNEEESFRYASYWVTIESHGIWEVRSELIELIKKFTEGEINLIKFSDSFKAQKESSIKEVFDRICNGDWVNQDLKLLFFASYFHGVDELLDRFNVTDTGKEFTNGIQLTLMIVEVLENFIELIDSKSDNSLKKIL